MKYAIVLAESAKITLPTSTHLFGNIITKCVNNIPLSNHNATNVPNSRMSTKSNYGGPMAPLFSNLVARKHLIHFTRQMTYINVSCLKSPFCQIQGKLETNQSFLDYVPIVPYIVTTRWKQKEKQKIIKIYKVVRSINHLNNLNLPSKSWKVIDVKVN